MSCQSICKRYKAKKGKRGYYPEGKKRCRVCEIFVDWNGTWCPCCNTRLSSRRRR